MKVIFSSFIIILFCTAFTSCNSHTQQNEQTIVAANTLQSESRTIDSLLQDKAFTESMAVELEAAYYKGVGEAVAPFLKPGEDSLQIDKSLKEEKIATNVAGFYALECAMNYLCSKDSTTPAQWIDRIIEKKVSEQDIEILNRFANATWKAGQPFRGLDRIKRSNFTGWSRLSKEEIAKDYRQIVAAAKKLQPLMKGTKEEQWQQLKKLLQSKDFALQVGYFMDSSYNAGENKAIPPFIVKQEETATKKKSFKEEKIATNIAGFYALECGLNYFVAAKKVAPSIILQAIIDNSISREDKLVFCRFANATWKAGQPFRSLDRITREVFIPFSFLSEADVEKDWVQVKAAAVKLKSALL